MHLYFTPSCWHDKGHAIAVRTSAQQIRRCWLQALTPQFNMKEVCSLVLQKDAVRGGGLKVKRDVTAGLSSVQREVEVGGGAAEGRRVPVVAFENQQKRHV